jgi:omega-amidase
MVGICYDLRFPRYSQCLAESGCTMIVFPAAFNRTTGPAHWELLLRARATDYQLFVAGVSPARNSSLPYQAWGHSTLCDPWGRIVASVDHDRAGIIVHDIDFNDVGRIREEMPLQLQLRPDVYERPAV